MQVIPFLDKQIPAERAPFEASPLSADFLILPTRFDAPPVVFCEVAAYALPPLASHTGRAPSIVRNESNGFTLRYEASEEQYAARIVELVQDPSRYSACCKTRRGEFERRLNWDAWGRRIADLVRAHLAQVADCRPS